MSHATRDVTIRLEYNTGQDEPDRGIFRNQAVVPNDGEGLLVAYHELDESSDVFPENPHQRQIHLVGTKGALEALGTYLIALARLDGADPEPYGSFDHVRFEGGGTVRLMPRRVAQLPGDRPEGA